MKSLDDVKSFLPYCGHGDQMSLEKKIAQNVEKIAPNVPSQTHLLSKYPTFAVEKSSPKCGLLL
jgi:hypothetical protein